MHRSNMNIQRLYLLLQICWSLLLGDNQKIQHLFIVYNSVSDSAVTICECYSTKLCLKIDHFRCINMIYMELCKYWTMASAVETVTPDQTMFIIAQIVVPGLCICTRTTTFVLSKTQHSTINKRISQLYVIFVSYYLSEAVYFVLKSLSITHYPRKKLISSEECDTDYKLSMGCCLLSISHHNI